MSRRDFLKRSIKTFFLLIASSLLLSLAYIYPAGIRKKSLRYFPVLDEDELPLRGVKRIDFSYEREGRKIETKSFLVVSKEGIIAFSPVCSHLGCLVNWDNGRKEFLCPCHGGRYNMDGEVIAGPPPRPLTRIPLEIRDGKVYMGIKV